MKNSQLCLFLLNLALVFSSTSTAAMVTLDFDGLKDGENLAGYYSGGHGGLGSGPGPALGVSISPGFARIAAALGGTGQFDSPPSSPAALFSDALSTVMVTGGFQNALSFYYLAPFDTVTVRIFNAGGDLLLASNLSPTPFPSSDFPYGVFAPMTLPFSGVANWFTFAARGTGGVYFDNIQLDSGSPVTIPEPSSSISVGVICLVCLIVQRTRYFATFRHPRSRAVRLS